MIAPRCPPHATAPSRALRPKIRLQPPSLRIPHRKRSQWCPRARKGQEHTVGLLYLPRYGRACLTRRPWNPETTETAPSSPSNTDRQPDLASHSLTKTVSKSLLTSLMVRLTTNDMMMQTLSLSLAYPEGPKMGRSVKWDQAAAMVSADCTTSCSSAFLRNVK